MTNRELAERIARAVLKAVDGDEVWLAPHDTYFDPQWSERWASEPDLAGHVLDVLHETGTGFCCYQESETGETLYQAMDDDAERMQAQAVKSVAEHQRGLFGEQEQP